MNNLSKIQFIKVFLFLAFKKDIVILIYKVMQIRNIL